MHELDLVARGCQDADAGFTQPRNHHLVAYIYVPVSTIDISSWSSIGVPDENVMPANSVNIFGIRIMLT